MGAYQKALQCRQNVVRYGLATEKCTGQKKRPDARTNHVLPFGPSYIVWCCFRQVVQGLRYSAYLSCCNARLCAECFKQAFCFRFLIVGAFIHHFFEQLFGGFRVVHFNVNPS